jgi:hypothetical protein
MKKLIIFIYCCFLFSNIKGQVTIGPEIGISYLPFYIDDLVRNRHSKKVAYQVGISGMVPISKNFTAGCKVSYVDRENISFGFNSFNPQYFEFKHFDLNFDFILNYTVHKYIHIGIGPSVTAKFFQSKIWEPYRPEIFLYLNDGREFMYGVNSKISIPVKRFRFNLIYSKVLSKHEIGFFPKGNNRYEFTVGYVLFRS